MAKKFYAVRNGKIPGIYNTWDECKTQVDGFSGAVFKGFETKDEAYAFLGIETKEKISECEAVAYCDGSFDIKTFRFSYGVIVFWKNEKYEFSESFSDSDFASMRNVAGEIKGAEKVFTFCVENGIKSVELFYDYEGIEKWCTGEWKRNREGTVLYNAMYQKIKDVLSVKFTKVKGHSGNKYNDEVDALAKAALGIK